MLQNKEIFIKVTMYYLFLTEDDELSLCCRFVNDFPDFVPFVTWGSLSNQDDRNTWNNNNCNQVVGGSSKENCLGSFQTWFQNIFYVFS